MMRVILRAICLLSGLALPPLQAQPVGWARLYQPNIQAAHIRGSVMENDSIDLKQQPDPIAEKMQDTATLEKYAKQAVFEAVDKARRLRFLPPAPHTPSDVGRQ